MGATWLWARGEWRHRGRLLFVAAIIAIAAGASMAAFAGARRADSALERLHRATGQPNVEFGPGPAVPTAAELEQLAASVDVLDEAMAIPGVEAVSAGVYWALNADPEAACHFAFGLAASRGGGPGIVVDGSFPSTGDGVMVNEAAAEQFGVRAGDRVQLHTVASSSAGVWSVDGGCAPLDGPVLDVEIAAVIRDLEDITDTAEPYVAAGPAFYERHAGDVANCVCAVRARVEPDRMDEAVPRLERLFGRFDFQRLPQERFGDRVQRAIGMEVGALRIAALAASLAGLLVVAQVLARQTAAHADGDRALVAMGLTRRQLAGGGVVAVAPAIVAGALGAVAFAVVASPHLPRGIARRAEIDPGVRLDLSVLVAGVATTLLVGVLAAGVTGWASARTVRTRSRHGATSGLPLPPPLALGARMAVNPGDGRSRAAGASAVAGVAIGVAGVLAVAIVGASRDRLQTTPELFGVSGDLAVFADDARPDLDAAMAAAVIDREVDAVAIETRVDTDFLPAFGPHGDEAAVEPEGMTFARGVIGPTVRRGRPAIAADDVALGEATAEELGVDVGDTVRVERIDGEMIEFRVAATVVSYGVDVIDSGFHLTGDGLARLAVPCGPAASGDVEESGGSGESPCADIIPEALVVRVAPGADVDEVAGRLASTGVAPLPQPSIVDRLGLIGPVPTYLAVFLVGIGGGGLVHAVLVARRRHERDLAVARTLGFTRRQATAAVRWHGLLTAAAGVVVGLLAGALIGRWLWTNLAQDIGAVVSVDVPLAVPVAVLGGGLLVAFVVTWWPARRAARTPIAAALHAE